jgi:hypothetical protein
VLVKKDNQSGRNQTKGEACPRGSGGHRLSTFTVYDTDKDWDKEHGGYNWNLLLSQLPTISEKLLKNG